MDRTGVIFFLLAFLLASATGVGLYLYLKGMPVATAEAELETVPVVVATQDMTFGVTLGNDNLKVAHFPKGAVPSGSYSALDSVVSHVTRVFLAEGEPVLRSKLSSVGGGLSLRIPEAKRAISVDVNEITGVSGFVLPGDRVDVLVTVDNAKGNNVAVTKTVVQDAEILAAGVKEQEEKKRRHLSVQTVTLLVSPNEAEYLALGAHQGQVHLVLRNPVDQELIADSSTDTRRVLGLYQPRRRTRTVTPKPKPVEEKKVEVPVIEERKFTIIRNGNITEQTQTVPVKEPEAPPVEKKATDKSDK